MHQLLRGAYHGIEASQPVNSNIQAGMLTLQRINERRIGRLLSKKFKTTTIEKGDACALYIVARRFQLAAVVNRLGINPLKQRKRIRESAKEFCPQ